MKCLVSDTMLICVVSAGVQQTGVINGVVRILVISEVVMIYYVVSELVRKGATSDLPLTCLSVVRYI